MIEIAKVTFVRVAEEELEGSAETISASRVSVMSGVHRKDVTRIQQDTDEFRPGDNLIARVVGHWQEDSRFTTKAGRPKTLTAEGRESEFVELVKSISGDLNPYTVLYELERMGAVERVKSGVKLQKRVFVPRGDEKAGLSILSRDVEDLMAAVEENVANAESETPNLHIRTEYDNVSPRAVPAIREWALKEGSAFHKRARDFIAKYDKDLNPTDEEGSTRVVVTAFSLAEDLSQAESEEESE